MAVSCKRRYSSLTNAKLSDNRNFRILYGVDFAIDCVAFRLDDVTGRHGRTQSYSADNNNIPLLEWVAGITRAACESRPFENSTFSMLRM